MRYIAAEVANVKAGVPQWQSTVPLGLAGRTLRLVGVGRLGTQTAKVVDWPFTVHHIPGIDAILAQIAEAFDVRVIAWSPNITPERAENAGVEYVANKGVLFMESDIVSLHLVFSEKTRHIITKDLALMKPTAFLINTSRGPLVDENALIELLEEERIAGAGLDVFDIANWPSDSKDEKSHIESALRIPLRYKLCCT